MAASHGHCQGHHVTLWPWQLVRDFEKSHFLGLLYSRIISKHDNDIHSQHIAPQPAPDHPLRNINIENNIQSRAMASLVIVTSPGWNGFFLHHWPSSYHIWIKTDSILYRTWILKFPENTFDFRHLMIFQTKTKTKIWMGQKDILWATGFDHICLHIVR